MFGVSFPQQILLYNQPTDMRKSFDGLISLVTNHISQDPLHGGTYVFVNKRRDKMKILLWDRHGFWLLYKRLEEGCFQVPHDECSTETTALQLGYEQLVMIIEGIDLLSVKRRKRFRLMQQMT
jgi:transposase